MDRKDTMGDRMRGWFDYAGRWQWSDPDGLYQRSDGQGEPIVFELVPVGGSLADDPAAVERAAQHMFELSDHDWDEASGRTREKCRATVQAVLRAAETGDGDE